MKYIDIHCHPNLGALKKDQDGIITQMKKEGVGGIVVGVDLASSREAVALAAAHDHLWATVGLHPHGASMDEFDTSNFNNLVTHPKTVALGECGIDYFHGGKNDKVHQWGNFERQLECALEHSKPLMIHCRPSKGMMDAYLDMLAYLEPRVRREPKIRGNIHFFVGNLEVAQRFWSIGFTTSFTGVLTFARDYDKVVKAAPRDMILTETDAPFASPAPFRGRRNKPTYVKHVVHAIARIRNEPVEFIRETVLANAKRVFDM